ncbi:crustacyanin-C1 subunit-like [Macrobrachium rosenbergii]|uniref:crustacyanin-C1 subunit-like n=1 Tax=Macrobrachium rosenbergii TaxID=79674 RepID=UPI0034D4AFDE
MNVFCPLLFAVLVMGGNAYRKLNIPDYVVPGTCPAINEKQLWEIQKPRLFQMGGIWYQISNTPMEFQPIDKCLQVKYKWDGEGFTTAAMGLSRDGVTMKNEGRLYPMAHDEPRLEITAQHSIPSPLVILDTDFYNYACLYSCMELGGSYMTDMGFVYSRKPQLHQAYQGICDEAFRKAGVDLKRFVKTYQGDTCTYPEGRVDGQMSWMI